MSTRFSRIVLIALVVVATLGAQNVQNSNIRGKKNREFSVIDYGATGNGTTDDTAAIQRAIDAAEVSGGLVDFPRGTYKISRITIQKPKVYLRGAGIQATILQTTVTTGSVVQFDSTAESASVRGGGMEGFTIYGATLNAVPTGTEIGLEILGDAVSNWYEMDISRIELKFLANGIKTSFQVDGRFSDITVDAVKKTTGIGIEVVNGHERWFNTVKTYNTAGSEGKAGIRIGAGSIGDYFDNISVLGSVSGVLIDPASEGVGTYANYAIWGQFSNLLVDSLTGCGINIVPASGKTANLWVFNNVWASSVANGVCTSGSGTISNIQVNGGRVRGASGNGFDLEAGTNIQIRGVNIEANARHGIYVSNTSVVDIQSNSIGHPFGDTQLYGIYLTGTTDAVNITGNSIRGNATGAIFDDTTTADKWISNNQNIDQGAQTVASAASITIDATPRITLTGTTTVNTMLSAPKWINRRVYIQATNAAPAQPTLTIGGTAGATFDRPITLKHNEIAECVYSGADFTWHCVGPNNPLVMVSLAAQNVAITSGNLYASAPVGTYEATAYLHTTTASAGSCTSNVTIGYTFNGAAKSVNVIAAHNHQVDEAASTSTPATFAVDNATHITRAVDLTAGGGDCSNAVYSLRIVLKKVI